MKEEPPSTAHLNKEQLASLFGVGSDTESDRHAVSLDQRKAEMLRDCLAGILPVDQAVSELLPEVFAELCDKIKLFTGQSFAALLADPATDIAIIRKIKEFNKTLVDSAPSAEAHDVAAVVYYAAIASALAHHDKRITSFSYASLRDSLKKLVESPWITPDLVALFQKAIGICQQEDRSKGSEYT